MKTPYWLISPATLFYSVFLVTPLVITFLLSFHGYSLYTGVTASYNLDNYKEVLSDDYFYTIFIRTFLISITVAILCTIIAIVETLILYKMSIFWKSVSLLIILGPLLVSVVVRTLGWALILGENGLISNIPVALGFSTQPISFMYTQVGVVVALVHVLVPFSIISIWASMGKLDDNTIDASLSLKASSFYTLRKVLIPQIMPGILSGVMVVFTLAITAFSTPSIIGGRKLKVVAMSIYDEFLSTLNWPLGASIAVILIVLNFIAIFFYNKYVHNKYRRIFND